MDKLDELLEQARELMLDYEAGVITRKEREYKLEVLLFRAYTEGKKEATK